MEEFHIFDVIESDKLPEFHMTPNCEHIFYVHKTIYDTQLLQGQETKRKTLHQFRIDKPRSRLEIDGEYVSWFPDYIKTILQRYCTQTVMGMPVQLMMSSGIVAECCIPHRLNIKIWGSNVFVNKKLRIIDDKYCMPVDVKINADMNDNVVVLQINSGEKQQHDIMIS